MKLPNWPKAHPSVSLVRHVAISPVFLSLALSVLEFSKRQQLIKKKKKVDVILEENFLQYTSSVAGQKQLQEKKTW